MEAFPSGCIGVFEENTGTVSVKLIVRKIGESCERSQLLEINGSKIQPDPVRYPRQTSMVCIVHSVLLCCTRKDTSHRSLAHGVDFFSPIRLAVQIGIIQIALSVLWRFSCLLFSCST